MVENALKMIWYFIRSPPRTFRIQQLLTKSFVNSTRIVSLMAQPYEIININNGDSQVETKQSNKPNG